MDFQDVTAELSHPDAQELLRTAILAHLAYAGKDGFPRAIPIGFHWNGEAVVVCTAPTSPKMAAMSAHPEVALTIDTDASPLRTIQIRGRATIEIVDGIPDEYLLASSKQMDTAQAQQFEANVRTVYKEMARITIAPAWARFYDFGAGRIPGFLLKLVNNA